MDNAEPLLKGIFFTRSGQIITRMLADVEDTLIVPMNAGDNRLFLKGGEVTTPFIKVTFGHVQTVPAAGFTLAIYEETGAAEFDPRGMTEVAVRDLEKDFEELNKGAA